MKATTAVSWWIGIGTIGLLSLVHYFKFEGLLFGIYLWPIVFFTLFSPWNMDKKDKFVLFLLSFIPVMGNMFVLMVMVQTSTADDGIVYNLNRTHAKYLAYLPFLLLFAIFFI